MLNRTRNFENYPKIPAPTRNPILLRSLRNLRLIKWNETGVINRSLQHIGQEIESAERYLTDRKGALWRLYDFKMKSIVVFLGNWISAQTDLY
ncbi:hypothetical protein [Bacillus spongiae]|uniref:hypothetical protein n=1 Tax=Bacillus spongiae TaxID=2683610 RepID=UPI0030151950